MSKTYHFYEGCNRCPHMRHEIWGVCHGHEAGGDVCRKEDSSDFDNPPCLYLLNRWYDETREFIEYVEANGGECVKYLDEARADMFKLTRAKAAVERGDYEVIEYGLW